jgi:NADH-quinone oxidoreductase subunit M
LSFDLFLLFVFYELAIIPKYFLIAIWGSTRREYGAMKLALYSFVGSAMVLVGIVAAYVLAGSKTMDLFQLARSPFGQNFQHWVFPLVFIGFGILAGLWPFHTWAPTGHVAAPTAASMLLAGVVMKLGAYGCLRVAMVLFPRGLDPWSFRLFGFGSWLDVFGMLAVIGVVYGAMVALVQSGAGAEGFQIRHRLFECQSHGICVARSPYRKHGWLERRGASDVFPWDHCRVAVRRSGANGLRSYPHAAVR